MLSFSNDGKFFLLDSGTIWKCTDSNPRKGNSIISWDHTKLHIERQFRLAVYTLNCWPYGRIVEFVCSPQPDTIFIVWARRFGPTLGYNGIIVMLMYLYYILIVLF